MAKKFPSEEWIQEFRENLNGIEEYEDVAEGWGVGFNGDFIFTVEADEHLDEDRHFFVGLEDGECTDAHEVEDPTNVNHGFRLIADYTDWKSLVLGEFGAIQAMMDGSIDLEGDMQKIMQYSDSSTILLEAANQIETEFIDE